MALDGVPRIPVAACVFASSTQYARRVLDVIAISSPSARSPGPGVRRAASRVQQHQQQPPRQQHRPACDHGYDPYPTDSTVLYQALHLQTTVAVVCYCLVSTNLWDCGGSKPAVSFTTTTTTTVLYVQRPHSILLGRGFTPPASSPSPSIFHTASMQRAQRHPDRVGRLRHHARPMIRPRASRCPCWT
ncbi:hypothetical protein T440DRAFT_471271 [Plenodomus tracheiphilus IPT5]|uniref:Uncharacterized protein n=1 Tax=Plenodomus tracheiphilus IPT5 TaxID=1408161 RepID=A0A6A7AWK2_9PLEO|nr:hypothetical protein T440DRAFT_471271 [Plenodomus tracheiphilus IPT5]